MSRSVPAVVSSVLLVVALALLPASASAAFGVGSVTKDEGLNFAVARCGPGWTGGDSTYSTQLPNGHTLWLYSDSFMGAVPASGDRDTASAALLGGNFLVEHDLSTGAMTSIQQNGGSTITRPTYKLLPRDAACPTSSYRPPSGDRPWVAASGCPDTDCKYWAGDIFVDDNINVVAFLRKFSGYQWLGTAVASVPASQLRTARPTVREVNYANLVEWGAAVIPSVLVGNTPYTYIYGTKRESTATCDGECVYLARAPNTSVTNDLTWTYWNGTGWTSTAANTKPLVGVSGAAKPMHSQEFSVAKVGTRYVMLGFEYGSLNKIVARSGDTPQGPWSGPKAVYTVPEVVAGTPMVAYNAHMHPLLANGSTGMLISYNLNAWLSASEFLTHPYSAWNNAGTYRPRFIRAKFSW